MPKSVSISRKRSRRRCWTQRRQRMSSRGEWITCRRGKNNARFTLIPVDARAIVAISKVPEGQELGVRILRDRSLPYHNRFWAMLDCVAQATEFGTAERLLVALKLR